MSLTPNRLVGLDTTQPNSKIAITPGAGLSLSAGGVLSVLGAGTSLLTFIQNGKIATLTRLDGSPVMNRAGTIISVRGFRQTAGAAGSTICDVNVNGTTIFPVQANRPTFPAASGNNLKVASGAIGAGAFAAGDDISVDVDAAETGNPRELTLTIEVQYS